MNKETFKPISPVADALCQFVLPGLSHKRLSDLMGKHEGWSNKKDKIITNLAIGIDAVVDTTVMVALLINQQDFVFTAFAIKYMHNMGAATVIDPLTGFFKNNLAGQTKNGKAAFDK